MPSFCGILLELPLSVSDLAFPAVLVRWHKTGLVLLISSGHRRCFCGLRTAPKQNLVCPLAHVRCKDVSCRCEGDCASIYSLVSYYHVHLLTDSFCSPRHVRNKAKMK